MNDTTIEWTDLSWNPVTGCTPVSEGCANCYARRMAQRLRGRFGYPEDEPFRVTLHPERLEEPLHLRKQRRIFVCSMGDLFHGDIEDQTIDEVFAVMLACRVFENRPDHIFQVLTKRPERMLAYLTVEPPGKLLERWSKAGDGWIQTDDPDVYFSEAVGWNCAATWRPDGTAATEVVAWSHPENLFPLPNVWLGVSCENQTAADERIPVLLQTPAAVRFVSVEPMLGPVNLEPYLHPKTKTAFYNRGGRGRAEEIVIRKEHLDWVVCGGETGPGARPMHPDWVRSLRDQAVAAGVPFFFKGWGDFSPVGWVHADSQGTVVRPDGHVCHDRSGLAPSHNYEMQRVGRKAAGRLLDGRAWDEYPQDERRVEHA